MGTNYYAYRIPKEEDKQKLIDAIDSDNFNEVVNLAGSLYGNRDEYTGLGGIIHLGKSSYGWKFLWNANTREYTDSYVDESGDYISEKKIDQVYPLTRQGITDFVMRDDIIIKDEYGDTEDKEDFLEYAFTKEGIDNKVYYEDPKHYDTYSNYMDERIVKMYESLGYTPRYHEFYSDGLRFSTSAWFA